TERFGTNIGAALTTAMDVAHKDDRPTRKMFVVVSDGEDFGPELRRALVAARAQGYQVDTIGVGTGQAVPIPVRGEDGRETLLRDDTGLPVLTRFAEGTLRDIASATGGQYVRSVSGDDMGRAIAAIAGRGRRVLGWGASTGPR